MTDEVEVQVESTEQEVVGEVLEGQPQEVEETPAEQPEEAAASDAEDPPKPKKDGGFQRRISELTADKRFLQDQLAHYQQLIQQTTQPQEQAKPQAEQAPKIEDYGNLQDFIAAQASYEAKRIVEGTLSEQRKAEIEHRRQQENHEVTKKAAERLEKARVKYDDFDDAFGSAAPLSEYMSEFIIRTEDGMDIAYYLAKNPSESERIARMDEFNAALALADVRTKIKLPVKKTNAPPPITPVKGASKAEKDPSEMSDEEFAEWRKKQIKGRGNS
jgi:hypothetical protein